MGRRKQMPGQPKKTTEFLIWWDTNQGYPMSTFVDVESEEDALKKAEESAKRSGGSKYGVKKMTERQFERMMVRVCPSSGPAF